MPGGKCRSPQSLGGTTITLFLYVPDVDQTFNQAVSAGTQVVMPVADMFWGTASFPGFVSGLMPNSMGRTVSRTHLFVKVEPSGKPMRS